MVMVMVILTVAERNFSMSDAKNITWARRQGVASFIVSILMYIWWNLKCSKLTLKMSLNHSAVLIIFVICVFD